MVVCVCACRILTVQGEVLAGDADSEGQAVGLRGGGLGGGVLRQRRGQHRHVDGGRHEAEHHRPFPRRQHEVQVSPPQLVCSKQSTDISRSTEK